MKAVVAGWGMAKFGRRRATLRDLMSEALKSLFENTPNLSRDDVEGLVVSSNAPERSGQTNLASLASELINLENLKYITRTEIACASGHAAIRAAWFAISAGMIDSAIVLGVEKMWLPYPEAMLITDMEREWDFPQFWYGRAPSGFALCAQEHMKRYGTTREQLAMISVKNHGNALLNPYSQELRRRPKSVEDVLNSRPVSSPFNLYDCSARVDGASALLIVGEDVAKSYTDVPVYLLGSGQKAIGLSLSVMKSYADWHHLKAAALDAYRMAKIEPRDIDVAEVHDCFTIAEIIEYEELGFCKKGEGGRLVEEGQTFIDGDIPVNPRGGLIGCGHPVGATGVAQVVEILQQLRCEAGKRQIDGCEIGLAHTQGGIATTQSILILGVSVK